MKLSDLSIRRPVLASMLSLALVLFGVLGYFQLSVREFPDVDPPIVSVSTVLPGANPQVVESAVTDILEEELSTVEGLRTLTSASQEGVSNITLEFNLDRDVEAAAQDTRDKVARVRERLPEDVEEPVVAKQDADAQPFFWLALSGANYDLLQLSDVGDRLVKSRLQTLPGVGQARIFGEPASRCGSGWTPRSWRPGASPCRTSRRRSGAATSKCRRAGSSRSGGGSRAGAWGSSKPRGRSPT